MKEKLLLIVGCSHAAGSEIDGTEDSLYNRKNNFGNLLAKKLERRAINIASNGASNQGIARTVLEWFSKCYDPNNIDLMVLVAWTESSRLEMPTSWTTDYTQWNLSSDFNSELSNHFFRVNFGYTGAYKEEQDMIAKCHAFMADNLTYIETISASLVLQMQYFFKMQNIAYLMCNTMHMFSKDEHLDFYKSQIDYTRYMDDPIFYWKYADLGYKNPKAKYWHHNEIPHQLFANELIEYINKYAVNDI